VAFWFLKIKISNRKLAAGSRLAARKNITIATPAAGSVITGNEAPIDKRVMSGTVERCYRV
jgi:hypothetical protein